MTGRLSYRLHTLLEHYLPEQRLFLRSDTETRYIRLKPSTQAIAMICGALVVAWTIVATAVILMDSIGSGGVRDQARREQAVYEKRLNTLSQARDRSGAEAAAAQERFNVALEQVSRMQSALLASEDRRKELETGIEVIQKTLRRTIVERDDARREATEYQLAMAEQSGGKIGEAARGRDIEDTLDLLTAALETTASERDAMMATADEAMKAAEDLALDKRLMEERNNQIFATLEEAVTISMEPLDKMFRAAGLSPDSVLDQVRRGYSGQGGPLTPLSFSTKGEASADQNRANAILEGLDRMNLYRLAASKAPFAMPIKSAFRFTSGFGYRRDPKGGGRRMHAGTDFAGAYGTPVYSTADGVVVKAGWQSGYGRMILIRHDFGIETRFAHLSQIRVKQGQRVSRGDRIGDMGNSGRSTGTHLHYEVRVGGKPINPMTYIKAARDVF
ncbi:MAG: DUF5930 domain-containing protein [Paracoccaceae bacterium]